MHHALNRICGGLVAGGQMVIMMIFIVTWSSCLPWSVIIFHFSFDDLMITQKIKISEI
jgi:hypothetical protein